MHRWITQPAESSVGMRISLFSASVTQRIFSGCFQASFLPESVVFVVFRGPQADSPNRGYDKKIANIPGFQPTNDVVRGAPHCGRVSGGMVGWLVARCQPRRPAVRALSELQQKVSIISLLPSSTTGTSQNPVILCHHLVIRSRLRERDICLSHRIFQKLKSQSAGD